MSIIANIVNSDQHKLRRHVSTNGKSNANGVGDACNVDLGPAVYIVKTYSSGRAVQNLIITNCSAHGTSAYKIDRLQTV